MKSVHCILFASALAIAGSVEAALTCHYTFDNPDDPLAAVVGPSPVVVEYSKNVGVNSVDGLGNCALVDDSALLGGLASGSGALSIPAGQALRIAHGVPTTDDHPWCISARFYLPGGDIVYRSIFSNDQTGMRDASLFINRDLKIGGGGASATTWGYETAITPGAWHVLTLSFANGDIRMYLDGELKLTKSCAISQMYSGRCTLKNCPFLFLSADESGEDGLLHFDWVKIWDEANPPDLFHSRVPVGLWEFPSGSPTHATIGADLELVSTVTGQATSAAEVDGVVPGDGAMRLNQYTAYRVEHQLTPGTPYTVVIDARLPSGTARPKVYHALWHSQGTREAGDPSIMLCSNDSETPTRVRFWGQSGQQALIPVDGGSRYVREDEWVRYVLTWDGTTRRFYANGEFIFSNTRASGLTTRYAFLHGDCDGQGEESPLDFTTMALYEGVMSADEVASLGCAVGSVPLAGDRFEAAPIGEWVFSERQADTVPSRIGEPLVSVPEGFAWRRPTPASADRRGNLTYVLDVNVGTEYPEGAFLSVDGGAELFVNWDGSIGSTGLGWSSVTPAWTPGAHRIIVANTDAAKTDVFFDGTLVTPVDSLGKLVDLPATASPTQTVTFLNLQGASLIAAAVYDGAVWPVGTPVPSDYDPAVAGENAQPVIGAIDLPAEGAFVNTLTEVRVACTDAEHDWYVVEIDFGDGQQGQSGMLRNGSPDYANGTVFTHVYAEAGSYPVRVRTYDALHRTSAWTDAGSMTVRGETPSDDVLATWPWQQNVYTNRFTVMCETKIEISTLELQWGEDFANTTPMTGVAGNGGTWIYSARVAVENAVGATIPYRLAVSGHALTGTSTDGRVKLWPDDANETFTCAVWGDNQQGAREGDWDDDIFLYVRRIFAFMVARDPDFGICTGDMSTSAAYASQIKPLDLEVTDGLFGATRPYYVAWGNHDTLYPAAKPYFETGAADDPDARSSACGNYFLYRGGVLFAFVDHQLREAPETVAWLTNLLVTPRARAAKFRVLVQHFPIYGETGNTLCAALVDVVKNGGVDLVLCGHMHGYERIEKDGFVQVTNGGLGCLDHYESAVNDYGDCTKIGGHNPLPYLWARQKSFAEPGVLGPAEPVRLALIQGYGELTVSGGVLSYRAHGFNADGSYIGIFDTVSITSKTVAASAPAVGSEDGACANPASFAEFTSRPVTNAKWKEFADAVGIDFAFADGAGDCAVTGVSKTEIARFLAWLNGGTGDYRLPTLGELQAAFGDNLARDVSEWTSTVDPATGRCRILGGNTNALAGVWCRAADRPMIATADCTANYLGFRLARGAAPAEPAAPFADALAALARIAKPKAAYRWDGAMLNDITGEIANPSGDLVYDDPVIFTGTGELTLATDVNVTFGDGLVAPRSTAFVKEGLGALVVGGPLKGGAVDSREGWILASSGTLTLRNVECEGTCVQFRSGDRTLRLVGDNVFASAAIPLNDATVTNLVASEGESASFRARSMRDYGNGVFRVSENVAFTLAEDLRCGMSEFTFDGPVDIGGFHVVGNLDPWVLGKGTLRTGCFGTCENSYTRLAISNIIFTSGRPWRMNSPKYSVDASLRVNRFNIAGAGVRIASLYDWTMPARDECGIPFQFMANTSRAAAPYVVFDTRDPDDGTTMHTFTFAPSATSASAYPDSPYWGFEKIGDGTLVLGGAVTAVNACAVRGGTLRLLPGAALTAPLAVDAAGTLELSGGTNTLDTVTFAGGTFRPADGVGCRGGIQGPFVLDQPGDGPLVLFPNRSIDGPVTLAEGTDKAHVRLSFEGNPIAGIYRVLIGSGLAAEQLDITHDVDPGSFEVKTDISEAGDVTLVLLPPGATTAVWVGGGVRTNPLDPRNWTVTDAEGTVVPDGVPTASTYIMLRGETSLNVPSGTDFVCGGIILEDDVALVDDCDWTGLGPLLLRDYATLDLRGHRLTAGGLHGVTTGLAEITDSTDDAAHPGELRVRVAEGLSEVNRMVRISGNLRFVKDGAGAFTASQINQTYTGGTSIEAGTFVTGASLLQNACGAYGTTINVAQGAVFDRGGRSGFTNYLLQLDGGTLTCRRAPDVSSLTGTLGSLVLTADSRIVFDEGLNLGSDNADLTVDGSAVWDLGGHTLDIVFAGNDPDFYVNAGMTLKNGTIRTSGYGWFHDRGMRGEEGGSLVLDTILRLNMSGAQGTATSSTISNLTITTTNSSVTSDGHQKVYGTFTPLSPYFFRVEMQNGSVLNLGGCEGTWNSYSASSSSVATLFANDATIGIDLGTRSLGGWTKIVAWRTPPGNLSSLTFTGAGERANAYDFRWDAEGVYARNKMFVIIMR